MLIYFNSNAGIEKVIIADGKSLFSQNIGNVYISTSLSDRTSLDINLINEYFIPELQCNVISVK